MSFLSIENLLKAYEIMSKNTINPSDQGATQKVSALRYLFALDRFWKEKHQNCDTKKKEDKEFFIACVGQIVSLSDGLYTSNFYTDIKEDKDYKVGSNFFSVNAVKESLTNNTKTVDFPKRGGSKSVLLRIKDGVLQRDEGLFTNINQYLSSDEIRIAFSLWLLRAHNLNGIDLKEIKKSLKQIYTEPLINSLLYDDFDISAYCVKYGDLELRDKMANITKKDVLSIFKNSQLGSLNMLSSLPLQQIFYGAPGTGKSFSIKSVIAEHMSIDVDQVDMEADNIFRTTFHPDYDYAQFVGCYKPTKEKNGDITYDFVPQVFVNALVEAYGGVQPAKSSSNTSATTGQVANSGSKEDDLNDKDTVVEQTVESEIETQAVKPVYLVIEEINRGNCAQIFGDIFQLLDRNANGESEYSISVDKDLREYLEINCPNAICNGKIKIPANLSIIATMNTSDQSLFPMDSAFKRRWEWEYVPIKNQNFDKDGNLIHFRIVVEEGRYEYDWNVFQNAVNVEIKEKTNSEDKQMGDYFIKKDVTLDEFINKVMFYLWNDVCKENYQTEDNFFRTKENDSADEVEFSFGEMMADKVNKINGFMRKLNVKNLIETSESTDASDVSTPESSAD